MTIEGMNKYSLSALAATRLEDPNQVKAALEEQVYSFGWNEDEAEGVIAGALVSEEGIKESLRIYTGKYKSALHSMSVGDLFTAYDPALRNFLGEGSEEYTRAMVLAAAHRDENYGDVAKAIMKATSQVKNARALGLSDDEINAARNTLERYDKVIRVLSSIEGNRLETLIPRVGSRATKRTLKETLRAEE